MKSLSRWLKVLPLLILTNWNIHDALAQRQNTRFAPALGNTQQIIASHLDRDSSLLFAYDASGTVVVWDTENMRPVRSFSTVPMDIWNPAPQTTYLFAHNIDICANQNKFWLTRTDTLDNGKNGVYDIYGRVSGTHVHQSDTTIANERIQLLQKDNGVVMTRTLKTPIFDQGKIFWGALGVFMNGDARTVYLDKQKVTCLRLSPDEQKIAIGYEWGGVDVYDMEKLTCIFRSEGAKDHIAREVSDILFLPDNRGIAYTYKRISPNSIILHEFSQTSPTPIPANTERISSRLAMALSPSGRYLAWASNTTLDIYELDTKKLVFSESSNHWTFGLDIANSFHFLNDEILLFAGKAQEESTYEGAVRNNLAGLYKYDWKADIRSANYARGHTRTGALLDGILASTGEGSVRIHNFSGGYHNWSHLVTPKRLRNQFLGYEMNSSMVARDFLDRNQFNHRRSSKDTLQSGQGGYGLLVDDALSEANWFAQALMADSALLLQIDSNYQSIATAIPFRHMHGYWLKRFHSTQKLLTWQKPGNSPFKHHLLVSDTHGKILLSDTVQSFGSKETPYLFSKDGAWFVYRRSNAEIVYVSTAHFDKKQILKTGLGIDQYLPNRIQFDQSAKRLAFQQYRPDSLNIFTLVQVELASNIADTLTSISLRPLSFALTGNFKQLALSYSLNIVDESLLADSARLATAAMYGMRNEYQPIIVHYNIEKNSYRAISTRGGYVASQLLIDDRQITALQQDGLLYYYDLADTNQVVIHQLEGTSQSLFTDSCYFATEELLPQINILSANGYHPVGREDIYYNRPHRFLKIFKNEDDLNIALYEKAYEKRLRQYNYDFNAKAFETALPHIRIDPSISMGFHTKTDHLKIPVHLDGGASIDRLFVTVNGYAIHGKSGITVAPGTQKTDLNIPLDSGYNHIQLQAVSTDHRYAPPVNLQYHADFTQEKKPQTLWVLAAGVSDYRDSRQRLQFAAKDAQDMTQVFTYKENYDTVMVSTLLNEQVQRDGLLEEIKKASSLGKDDVFILYLAGHGLLDENANFYYATHDMNFEKPAEHGLGYDVLMSALEQLPVRNKLLLLDACHSGLVDHSMIAKGDRQLSTSDGMLSVQGARGAGVRNTSSNARLREQDVFLFMQQTFSSLAYDNQVSVLSAALGNNLALENSKLQNGLFTYALIKGLGLAKATDRFSSMFGDRLIISTDDNATKRAYGESSTVTVEQLQRYIQTEVQHLSRGYQVPSFTLSSTAADIRFSESSYPKYLRTFYHPFEGAVILPKEEKYKLFLDRYKDPVTNQKQ